MDDTIFLALTTFLLGVSFTCFTILLVSEEEPKQDTRNPKIEVIINGVKFVPAEK